MPKKHRRKRAAAASPGATAAPAAGPAAPTLALSVTLATPLWAALIGLAAALRIARLDSLFLTVSESVRSYSAWLVAEGSVPGGWPGDTTAALTSYVFRIFGAGDVGARIIPALAGAAMVALLWLAMPYVGRGGALLAAALIAFSPVAVHISRSTFPFALGGLLSLVMVLSLFAYLRQRQPWQVALLAAAFALGLATDPIAVATGIALIAFLVIELVWRRPEASTPLAYALATFRADPVHWRTAALAFVAALLLGIIQFGTDIDRLSLPGLRLWADMFDLPRDDFPWHYQFSLLLGYEWPLLLAGAAALFVLLNRLILAPHSLTLFQRFLLVWIAVAVAVIALATRREAGQLLLLLLPLALLAGSVVEDVISAVDWDVLRRWWPLLVLALALITYGVVLLNEWSRQGGRISGVEKVLLVLTLLAAASIIAAGFYYLGRHGQALALPLAAALAVPFLLHSSLALAFNDGSEFVADARISDRIAVFGDSVDQLAVQTGQPVVIDPDLGDVLGWYLRGGDVLFGDPPAGAAFIARPLETPPQGYVAEGEPWLLAQGWFPRKFNILPAWRWLAYRQPYGNVSIMEAQIYVPTP